ncbi:MULTISPECIES: class I adenylate-forming enzyme family protein [Desulfobacula]|nr:MULTISPECIES: class I adenylate-forming enzyme family protein [Desulfobacula]SDU43704.1 long-chain acyl-CoA synthetase [Desulfobacula phenolica]
MMINKQQRTNIVDIIRKENFEQNSNLAVTRSVKDGLKNSITYSELFKEVEKYSKKLSIIGFTSHDRIALFCEDSIEYVIMALAILDTDAVIVPISPSLSSNELEILCNRIKVKYIVSEKKITTYSIVSEKYLDKLYLYEIDKNIKYSKYYMEVNSPAFIRFSSGTTGESKGVLLTHQAIIDRTSAADERLNIASNDIIGWFLSMSFHFVVSILLFLRKRAHIVLSQNNFPTGFIDSFETIKPTFLYASPFYYNLLATHKNISSTLLSDVRMAVVTAVSLNKKTERKFYDKFNIHLSQAYGIIEVGLPFINDRFDDEYICSVGKLLPSYDLKIKDPDDKGQGRIYLKGKGMYSAYISPWKKQTQWFDTGDIGYLKNSYLFISGRSKNIINFAGMKIFPEEVEKIILSYDNIKEVRVFAERHDVYGQLPIAEFVLASKEELNVFKLKKYCLQHLDSYKIPKEFIEVESIEKTLSQKIKRT